VTTREERLEAADRYDGRFAIMQEPDHRLAALACRAMAKEPVAWRCEACWLLFVHVNGTLCDGGGGACGGRLRALYLESEETGT